MKIKLKRLSVKISGSIDEMNGMFESLQEIVEGRSGYERCGIGRKRIIFELFDNKMRNEKVEE